MNPELREDLTDLLNDLRNGWELCASRGMAGYDLPVEVTAYIRKMLEEALEGKENGRKTRIHKKDN